MMPDQLDLVRGRLCHREIQSWHYSTASTLTAFRAEQVYSMPPNHPGSAGH
jgi:hypothetical protein